MNSRLSTRNTLRRRLLPSRLFVHASLSCWWWCHLHVCDLSGDGFCGPSCPPHKEAVTLFNYFLLLDLSLLSVPRQPRRRARRYARDQNRMRQRHRQGHCLLCCFPAHTWFLSVCSSPLRACMCVCACVCACVCSLVQKDPNAPKGPKSAYILFSQDKREDLKKEFPEASQTELMQKCGEVRVRVRSCALCLLCVPLHRHTHTHTRTLLQTLRLQCVAGVACSGRRGEEGIRGPCKG